MARATSCLVGQLALGLARPVIGLAHDVGDAADLDRQLLAIVRQPRALVDDAGDGGRLERLEPMLLDDRGDHPGIGVVVLGGAGDGVVEIGLHLEEPGKVGIVGRQQVVELAVADQHHAHVERDRLGIERLRGHRTEARRLGRLLDADLASLEGALQGLPGEG